MLAGVVVSGNCTDGKGYRTEHRSEGFILSPDGVRVGQMCRACAQVVIDEYREKLGQEWTFLPAAQLETRRPEDPKDIIIRTLRAEVERLAGDLKNVEEDKNIRPTVTVAAGVSAAAARALLARLEAPV